MNRIKVVLINSFSNPQVREKLNLHSSGHYKCRDFGGWNTDIINGLKDYNEIELHVITNHSGMKSSAQEFELDGVYYHFYNPDVLYSLPFLSRTIFSQKLWNYSRCRRIVKQFIKKIQPDIVNLIGAENVMRSLMALDIDNAPVIIHLQTVYANPARIINAGGIDKKRWNTELKVFHKTPYMACSGQLYYDLVKKYEPNAIVFPRTWPASQFPTIPDVSKTYDFVFFARYLNKNKGFDSAIEALGEMVDKYPGVKLLAIGAKDENWLTYENRIKELGLQNNIEIHAPFAQYNDVLKYVKQARFSLLPITMDVISGTIIESMRMGLPVITCRTSGTPSLNKERETVLIAEIGDTHQLASYMEDLYEHPEKAELLRNNAFEYLKEEDEKNFHNIEYMVAQYKAVIDHYRYGTPIPQELLFKSDNN